MNPFEDSDFEYQRDLRRAALARCDSDEERKKRLAEMREAEAEMLRRAAESRGDE